MALAPGSRLGPYEILAPLGAGGMGEVYRARDARLGRTVAIKILTSDLAADPLVRERFEREARIVALLNHPNICTLYDVGREGNTVFLVMEYIDGETLESRLKSGPLPASEVLRIGIEIADALEKAHRRSVIHRDLKPANVMLTETGVKLLDFGIATISQPPTDKKPSQETTTDDFSFITTAGQVIGTASFMSPEQVRGQMLDARTDLWSLSVILYQMACGRLPFEGPTINDLISFILMKEPAPMSAGNQDVPKWLVDIVMKGLEKDRERRYQSARELLSELHRYKRKREIESELERMGKLPKAPNHMAVMPAPRKSGEIQQAAPGAQAGGKVENVKTRKLIVAGIISVLVAAGLLAVSWILSLAVLAVAGGAIAGYVYYSRTDSLAVMPFEWAGTGPQQGRDLEREYLADGITESLINTLSHLDRLKVISRTSVFRYKGKELNLQQVRRELDVLRVLTGRIFPRGPVLAVSVELVDVLDGKHIWGEKYECPMNELAGLHRKIAEEVSRSLRARTSQRGAKIHAPSAESYQSYLKGKYFWNKRKEADIRKAIECFEAAVKSDPGYALAHVGLAECYIVLGVYSSMPLREAYAQARNIIEKALAIDDKLAEAHAAMAVVKAGEDWDLRGALLEFERAIQINPNYATAHQWYAEHLVCAGMNAQAIAEAKRARELDPMSLIINESLAQVLVLAREYDQAIDQLRVALELDNLHYVIHRVLRDAYQEKGLFEDAIAEHVLAVRLAGEEAGRVDFVGKSLRAALAAAGPAGYWQKRIELATEDMQGPPRLPYDVTDVSPYHVAYIYAKLGFRDLAVKWLQKAFEERDYGIYFLKAHAAFDDLQSEPQVAELVRKIGLTE